MLKRKGASTTYGSHWNVRVVPGGQDVHQGDPRGSREPSGGSQGVLRYARGSQGIQGRAPRGARGRKGSPRGQESFDELFDDL